MLSSRFTRPLVQNTAAGAAVLGLGAFMVMSGPRDAVGQPVVSLKADLASADQDGDGLTDSQEYLVGTSSFALDTDGDGFGDAEEFARHSNPLDPLSMPAANETSGTLLARGEGGKLRLVLSLYEPDGLEEFTMIRIGALSGGRIVSVPLWRILGLSDVRGLAGYDGGTVTTIDIPVSPHFVHGTGMATFFMATGQTNTMTYTSAAKVDIRSEKGELVLQRPIQASLDRQVTGVPGGSLREPIPVSTPPPASAGWVAGAICYQRSEVVGTSGPRILHEIVEAECLEGWDSFCSTDCTTSVGSTYETVDPLALIGG